MRHDRVHNHDQTVVTVWDLRPWEAPAELPRAVVAWHKAMLKRAVKHADAVVAPTHALAQRLIEVAPLGDRIRVIAGASPIDFAVPSDEVGRRRALDLPEAFLLLAGEPLASDGLDAGFAAVAASVGSSLAALTVTVLAMASVAVLSLGAVFEPLSSTRVSVTTRAPPVGSWLVLS